MYNDMNNIPSKIVHEPMSLEKTEETIHSIMEDIMNMSKHCSRMCYSIKGTLFGPDPVNGQTEKPISCFIDAMKEVRDTLRETAEELENIDRRI